MSVLIRSSILAFCATVALLFLSQFAYAASSAELSTPTLSNGKLSGAGQSFNSFPEISLLGEWHFKWDALLEPAPWPDLKKHLVHRASVPGTWNNLSLSTSGGENTPLPGNGAASYVLQVTNFKGSIPSFRLPGLSSAARVLYVTLDGEVFAEAEVGKPGLSLDSTVPVPHALLELAAPRIIPSQLETKLKDGWYVLLQVSNYHDNQGGIWNNPVFVSTTQFNTLRTQERFLAAMMFGVLLIIGSYHLVLFAQRRDDLSALYFAGFCLSISGRTFAMSLANTLGFTTSSLVYETLQSIEYTSMPIMMATAMCFLEAILPAPWFKRAIKFWALGFGGPLFFLALCTSKSVFGLYLQVYQIQILGVLVLVLVHLVAYAIKGSSLARWCLLAFGLVAFGAVNDILHSIDIIETAHIAPFTMIGFVLMQAGILSARNAAIARERDVLNATKLEVLRKSEEAARIKSEFLANMSHELRTPLNALCNIPRVLIAHFEEVSVWECPRCSNCYEDDGSADADDDAPECPQCAGVRVQRITQQTYQGDEDEHRYYLQQVDQQAQSLLGLIERVLTFNDLQKDSDEALNIAHVDIRAEFTPLFEHYRAEADKRCLTLDVHYDGVTELVAFDQAKVEQCLDLVVDNALKFTVKYGEICCTLHAQDERNLRITVQDTGIGIASKDLPYIFDPFYQVESSHTREFGGAGLGLALVKELTEAHSGSVSVESELGVGTTFTIEFYSP